MNGDEILIAQRYRLGRQLGEGSFGEVFSCTDIVSNMQFAVKMEPSDARFSQLAYENRVYRLLRGQVGVPRVQFFGKEGDYMCLVMQLLGDDMETVLRSSPSKRLPVSQVARIGVELFQRLRHMHQRGLLHRDVKPQNILLSTDPAQDRCTLFICDFGLSKRFVRKSASGVMSHTRYRDDKSLTGTPRYASVNCQLGIEQSRRDDMESALYVLIYLAKGRLPWQGLRGKDKKEKNDKILRLKQRTSVRELCEGLPDAFAQVLHHTRGLEYEEKPDYDMCERLLGQTANILPRKEN